MSERLNKILLIDDDKVTSTSITKTLEKEGYQVDHVSGGAKGLEMLEEPIHHIVLLDIEMPDMSGSEVLKEIRKKHDKNSLPVIMVSSNSDVSSVVEFLKEGANDYVIKPINAEILSARIATQLDIKSLATEFGEKKKLEAVNAMITTYNHEINNPLTIAYGMMEKLNRDKEFDEKTFEKLKKAMDRITEIMKKINQMTLEENIEFDEYVKNTKMIKI